MSISSFGQKQLDKIAKTSADNIGNILIFTSVGGWLASSIAQITGIALNKNYTRQQKKYMLSQESADAAINIGSFFLLTKSLKNLSSKMVSTAKLAPKVVVDFLKKNNLSSSRGQYNFDITKIPNFKDIRQTYSGFKCFVDSAAAITGGIISSNIITPVLRNEYASHKNNLYLSGQKLPQNNSVVTPRHTFDDFRKISLNI